MMNKIPIVLFVYNRPWHTEQTLRALKENDLADQSVLYIYSDDPKHLACKDDIDKIEQVRKLVKSVQWCKEVHIRESKHHRGLTDSIVHGVTEVVNKHGKVIVLEDDLLPSKGFLTYMNKALEIYESDEKVMHISSYMYPARFKRNDSTFFLNILSCWGWGTWKKAWDYYIPDVEDHLNYFSRNKKLKKKFDIEGHAYFFKQLEMNVSGELNTWAVRWYASWLRAGGYSLFPYKSLTKNIGHDDSGIHCKENTMYDVDTVDYVPVKRIDIKENKKVRKAVNCFYKRILKRPINYKMIIKSILYKSGFKYLKISMRWMLRRIYPELAFFDAPNVNLCMIKSSFKNTETGKQVQLYNHYHIKNCYIGDYTYISMNSRIFNTTIGKFCSIGPNFLCGWGVHPIDGISTHPMFYSTQKQNGMTLSKTDKVQEHKPIKIGNDVFIGMNVTILDGVTIGDGAVIGAGAVASKDIPPYAIAVGNPVKIIKYRFDEKTIKQLLKIKWWDLDVHDLKKVEENFFDITKFISKYKK